MNTVARKRGLASMALMSFASIAVVAGVGYALFGARSNATAGAHAQTASLETTGSVVALPARSLGKSGLPLPRFVSLKTDRVNVRRGPSSEHSVSWVFTRKQLPVEIVAEFDHWRRIRDADGEEGWIYQSLLTGRRTAMVAPWRKDNDVAMMSGPDAKSAKIALVRGGVIGRVEECTGTWCRLEINGYDGWVEQAMLWGVYPGESISD